MPKTKKSRGLTGARQSTLFQHFQAITKENQLYYYNVKWDEVREGIDPDEVCEIENPDTNWGLEDLDNKPIDYSNIVQQLLNDFPNLMYLEHIPQLPEVQPLEIPSL